MNCQYETFISTTNYVKRIGLTIATIGFGANEDKELLVKISTAEGNYFNIRSIDSFIEIILILTKNGHEVRDKIFYAYGTNFVIGQAKKETIIKEEIVTKDVE